MTYECTHNALYSRLYKKAGWQKSVWFEESDGGVELQAVHPSSFAICSSYAGLLGEKTSPSIFSHSTIWTLWTGFSEQIQSLRHYEDGNAMPSSTSLSPAHIQCRQLCSSPLNIQFVPELKPFVSDWENRPTSPHKPQYYVWQNKSGMFKWVWLWSESKCEILFCCVPHLLSCFLSCLSSAPLSHLLLHILSISSPFLCSSCSPSLSPSHLLTPPAQTDCDGEI